MSHDRQRLRDASDRLRPQAYHPGTGPLTRAILTAVADWLQDTARRADNPLSTVSRIDLEHAHRIADAVLATADTTQEGPSQ